MGLQTLTIEEFDHILNQWVGKRISVTKEELNDYDETTMELQSVSYFKNTQRLDDYASTYQIQLNGEGNIQTVHNNVEPLPTATYEIPLEDESTYKFDGAVLELITERGSYTIKVDES